MSKGVKRGGNWIGVKEERRGENKEGEERRRKIKFDFKRNN
jgi:hypothetical protein